MLPAEKILSPMPQTTRVGTWQWRNDSVIPASGLGARLAANRFVSVLRSYEDTSGPRYSLIVASLGCLGLE